MADQTPNFSFDLPIVGADSDAWGAFLNDNWSALDTLLATFMPLAGGSFSGAVTFDVTAAFTGIATFTVPPISAVAPTTDTQVPNKLYVDDEIVAAISAISFPVDTVFGRSGTVVAVDGDYDAFYLNLGGGTMTGDLVLSGAPDADLKAATKKYVDDADALKANLASPALTGNPTAPTQTEGNNSTRLASTAFVTTAVAALSTGIIRYTAKTTTSGTSKTFTGIPAGTNRIIVMLDKVSLSGSEELEIRIGDAGGIEASVYESKASVAEFDTKSTTGFILIQAGVGSTEYTGIITLARIDGNTWLATGNMAGSAGAAVNISAGTKTLSAELTQIQLVDTGSDSFDGGLFNILTEV